MSEHGSQTVHVRIITPRGDPDSASLKLIVSRWELIKALALRSVRTRYRGTHLGFLWAFAQPLLYMLVLNAFFGLVFHRRWTGDVPYPLLLLTGLVTFQMVSRSIAEGSSAILSNQGIISKNYIPPIVFPVASTLSSFVDFLLSTLLLVPFFIYYQIAPSENLLFIPIILLFLFLLCAAAQLFMSVVAARFSDVRLAVPAITQLLFFGSPVFYPVSIIPEAYLPYYYLNPMVGIVEAVRWSVLGGTQLPDTNMLLTSAGTTIGACLVAIVVFRRLGRQLTNYLG
jgi:lipopolysaccharide transport system permease protein